MPSIKHQLVQLNSNMCSGNSFSHVHLQKVLNNNKYNNADIGSYLESIYPFGRYSSDEVSQFSQLILKGIELERQYSSTHYAFFHGTRATKLILLRTLLEQTRQRTSYQNFFLLRNKGKIDHLRGIASGYQYTTDQIKSVYTSKNRLGRFDNDQPIRSDLLSVNTAMLVGAKEGSCEDSISYLDKETRLGPAQLNQKIEECLKDYGIDDLPETLRYFLQEPIGSALLIFIPRPLASLSYVSYPFGIPVGLPQSKLLQGRIPQQEFQEIVKNHEEYPLSKFFTQYDEFHQARILLNPQYFEKNTGDIKMHLFVWENQDVMDKLRDKFSAVVSKMKTPVKAERPE